MDNSYYFMHIGALIGVGPLMWLWGWGMLSCYFPFLLSAKYYYVVKNPILRKILISTQLSRSQKSRTQISDRNKLPMIGIAYYVLGTISLIVFYISDICAMVKDTIGTNSSVIYSLAFLAPYSVAGIALLCVLTFLFYRIDYGVGKHLYFSRGGSN